MLRGLGPTPIKQSELNMGLHPLDRQRAMNSGNSNPTANDMQAEIECRLGELGWSEERMSFSSWSPQRDEWAKLVEQFAPKELNDEAWEELKHKLIPLLGSHHESCLEAERDQRRTDRRTRLSQIFSGLREETPPLVSFQIREYGDPESRPKNISQEVAFPEPIDALQWPIVKCLLEADTAADELEQAFTSHQAEIDNLITEWRNQLHKQMLNTIPKPNGEILCPLLTLDTSNPYTNLPDETKLLLRADSLFLITNSSTNVFTYQDIIRFTQTDAYSLFGHGIVKPERPLDIKSIAAFPLARSIAKMLLKSMGCPDASYLELEGKWICGRCHDAEPKTWAKMVEHYVQEQLLYFTVRADVRRMNITYHELHDPGLFTGRPMVKYMSNQGPDEEHAQLGGRVWQCKICATYPIRRDVRGGEAKVFKHLLEAHDIQHPKPHEHYGAPGPVEELNHPIGIHARDLPKPEEDEQPDDGEMYEYDEDEFEEEPEYDSEFAAEYGYGYDEWGG